MMKAKSRLKSKRDNETPEKCLSDDSQGNVFDVDNNKVNDSYSELKITEDILQEFYKSPSPVSTYNYNTQNITVRHPVLLENQKPLTKRVCVLKKAPPNVPAFPSSSLIDQNSLRFDESQRPIQHSILGSVEDYFRMSLNKKKLTLNDIPSEYHHTLGLGPQRRPFSAMFPVSILQQEKENIFSQKAKNNLGKPTKFGTDLDTNALRLWQKRMQERKKIQNYLSKKIERSPEQLVFNSTEEIRKKIENCSLISKGMPFHNSGYEHWAGCEFWQQNLVVGRNSKNSLHMTNTETEKGFPLPILHVGVTNKIKEEKGVPIIEPGNEKRNNYYHTRLQELNDVITELDPFQPEFNDLIVIGCPVKSIDGTKDSKPASSDLQKIKKSESLRTENLSRPETVQGSEKMNELFVAPRLLINSLKLDSINCEKMPESQIVIRMVFDGYAKQKSVEKICLQNRGTSVIRFWWKKLESYDPFNLENKNIRRFYFNTSDGILLPNQDLDIPIIFKSEKSGIFSEMWKIETLPSLSSDKNILIAMKGVAIQRDFLVTIRRDIDDYLKYQEADNICRSIVEGVFQNVFYEISVTDHDDDIITDEQKLFNDNNDGMIFDTENVYYFKRLNDELTEIEPEVYEDWNMNCSALKKGIISAKSMKPVKMEEMWQKVYKYVDRAMIPKSKAAMKQKTQLYLICYRNLLDFFSQMVDALVEVRNFHDIPELEMRFAYDRIPNVSRQRTSNSQSSKKLMSASTNKTRSKELSNLTRDLTNISINEPDEIDKIGSQNAVDVDETIANNSEHDSSAQNDTNTKKYNFKSFQIVYSLLDKTINSIIECWDDITISDL